MYWFFYFFIFNCISILPTLLARTYTSIVNSQLKVFLWIISPRLCLISITRCLNILYGFQMNIKIHLMFETYYVHWLTTSVSEKGSGASKRNWYVISDKEKYLKNVTHCVTEDAEKKHFAISLITGQISATLKQWWRFVRSSFLLKSWERYI